MSERYALALAPGVHRALPRLPVKVADAALTFCEGPLRDNPHRVGKPLVGHLAGRWSARRGDYRVVYRIDDQTHRVYVERIEHRADVYRPR